MTPPGRADKNHDGGTILSHYMMQVGCPNEDGCLFVLLLCLSYDCNWFRCLGQPGAAGAWI